MATASSSSSSSSSNKRHHTSADDASAAEEELLLPREFFCPISQDLMTDPVQASDGYTYDRRSIENSMRASTRSPLTGADFEDMALVPNIALRGVMENFFKVKKLVPMSQSGFITAETAAQSAAVVLALSPTEHTEILWGKVRELVEKAWREALAFSERRRLFYVMVNIREPGIGGDDSSDSDSDFDDEKKNIVEGNFSKLKYGAINLEAVQKAAKSDDIESCDVGIVLCSLAMDSGFMGCKIFHARATGGAWTGMLFCKNLEDMNAAEHRAAKYE